jgi:hypothetical protein
MLRGRAGRRLVWPALGHRIWRSASYGLLVSHGFVDLAVMTGLLALVPHAGGAYHPFHVLLV